MEKYSAADAARKRGKLLFSFFLALFFALFAFVGYARADAAVTYGREATLMPGDAHPGVYTVTVQPSDTALTMGIPSIAKQTLEDHPTTESPAIIMGAAVPYEVKTGPTEFTPIPGGSLYAPYSYFRYNTINEQAADKTWHKKLSGFDGSYVIIRVDVSELIKAVAPEKLEKSFLHVKQEGNASLQVLVGPGERNGASWFSTQQGNMAAVYPLKDNAKALKDTDGTLKDTPYVDVIIMSSGTLVAGADTGSTDPAQIKADFKLKFYVDETGDYRPDLVEYVPGSGGTTTPTLEDQWLAKYYDETKMPAGTKINDYTVMGSDLELEVVNDDGPRKDVPEYWSLRKALAYPNYNDSPIRMICEVPVLEGLMVDGSDYPGDRKVIFDVNSFDIQIANHQSTGAAALTVKNASLTLKDGFNTTGAELAVGNNARMTILKGGILIIDETCQLEVEYDAASTTPTPGQDPPPAKDLESGVISIESGGKIINNGVLTIEGTEGKPVDPANPTIRDMKNAVLDIKEGGTLTNNGCLLSYGSLYCMGTIENNGRYDDVITSKDPDKGNFTYHKGLQISWKDDVTQESVLMGSLYIGEASDNTKNPDARLKNSGDVVLVPGVLECSGIFENLAGGNMYVCPVMEAVIPITPTADKPLERTKRIAFGKPMKSYLDINEGGTLQNAGNIQVADVKIIDTGRTGDLTPQDPSGSLYKDLVLHNRGTATNDGSILLDGVFTYAEMTNTGTIGTRVEVCKGSPKDGILYDKAATKLTEVFNAALTVDGNTNIWSHAVCTGLDVQPGTQTRQGGTTPAWTITPKTDVQGEGIRFWVEVFQAKSAEPELRLKVESGKANAVTGPVLPQTNSNIVYSFYVQDATYIEPSQASVTVSSDAVTPPSANTLVYNGKEQTLATSGGAASGSLEYRLGEDGTWSSDVPKAKDAGTYQVFYRRAGSTEPEGSSNITIAKRPVVVTANDLTNKVGTPLKAPEYTTSGLVEGETLNGVAISVDTDGSKDGTYPITVTVEGENPNYEVTCYPGTYTVTKGGLDVTVKDKYGVWSDEVGYKGFNIDLSTPSDAAAIPYYSLTEELTADNYKTAGSTAAALKNLPAGAGIHTVYYYVTNGTDVIKGSKHVIIDKALKAVPTNISTKEESYKNAGDGALYGFPNFAQDPMEYRRADNDGTYTKIYYGNVVNLTAGIYLVRRAGDENHYPSTDLAVTIGEGGSVTVGFYLDPGSETPLSEVKLSAVGETVEKPEDPVKEGYKFLGWFLANKLYDFARPVTEDLKLYGHWDGPHVHKLRLVEAKDATCTEDGNTAYYICDECGKMFEDATALKEITDPTSVDIPALGHKFTKTEAAPATCTEDGNIEYYVCSVCGKWYKDEAGKNEITDKASVVQRAFGHAWDAGVVTKPATALHEGIRTYTCLHDSTHTKTEVIPPTGRKPSGGSGDSGDSGGSGGSGGSGDSGGSGGSGIAVGRGAASLGSGSWSLDASGWHYTQNGAQVKGAWRFLPYNGLNYWYWFGEDGVMKTGWLDQNGAFYYLYPVSDGWKGRMLTGWQQINGKWYYFETAAGKNQGRMYRSELTPDGYYVGEDGAWDGNRAEAGR